MLYSEKSVKRSTLEQMWTPVKFKKASPIPTIMVLAGTGKTKMAIAWWRTGGQWQGFHTYIARYADDKLTIVVLTNLAYPKLDPIAEAVAKHYLSEAKTGAGAN